MRWFHCYISNISDGHNAVSGSQNSLMTPYLASCPNESTIRDTTIITTPELTEFYVRWYQKWTGSFQNSVQQKFNKFYNPSVSSDNTITAQLSIRPNGTSGATSVVAENYMYNIEKHFDKGACNQSTSVWVTPVNFTNCYIFTS